MRYVKPEIRKIDLKVAETAGTGCKFSESGDGPENHISGYACYRANWSLCEIAQS